jgi:hypothetical protein
MAAMFQNKIILQMKNGHKPSINDWRRQGQEKYLKGVELVFIDYQPCRSDWEHDHCEFCHQKFSHFDEDLKIGYTTKDKYRWICIDCFKDFKEEFGWITNS